MSKITPKNLSYDTTLPPFLARLQQQNTNQDGRQDYHAARPQKPRDLDAEAEDEPVFFDEATGDTLTKKEWEEREKFGDGGGGKVSGEEESAGREKGEDGRDDVDGNGKGNGKGERKKGEEKIAVIGGSRKRKAGKVVGGGEDETEDGETMTSRNERNDSKSLKRDDANSSVTESHDAASKPGKKSDGKGGTKKKGKKIKLSFGDDE